MSEVLLAWDLKNRLFQVENITLRFPFDFEMTPLEFSPWKFTFFSQILANPLEFKLYSLEFSTDTHNRWVIAFLKKPNGEIFSFFLSLPLYCSLHFVLDIDECSTGSHQCSQHCENTIGSYLCSCQPGFSLSSVDQVTCESMSKSIIHSSFVYLYKIYCDNWHDPVYCFQLLQWLMA